MCKVMALAIVSVISAETVESYSFRASTIDKVMLGKRPRAALTGGSAGLDSRFCFALARRSMYGEFTAVKEYKMHRNTQTSEKVRPEYGKSAVVLLSCNLNNYFATL